MMNKITVIGVGGTGCRIIAGMRTDSGDGCEFAAIDSDAGALDFSGVPESNRILAGEPWRHGRGCGGNAVDGQRAVGRERRRIAELLENSGFALVVAGLGGGISNGGLPVLCSELHRMKIPNLFMVTLPFTIEGYRKAAAAGQVLDELLKLADAVIVLPNDLLFCELDATTPLADACRLADAEFSRAASAVSEVLLRGNLFTPDFEDLASLLHRRKQQCGIGIGEIGNGDEPDTLVERALASPLLGGPAMLDKADAVLAVLLGGNELSIGDARAVTEQLRSVISPDTELLAGASVDGRFGGRTTLVLIPVKFEDAPVSAEIPEVQAELALEIPDKGIMKKGTAVHWNGEELDVPSFKRKNLVIDTGRIASADTVAGED